MPRETSRKILETSAIVVGYAMSRLDKRYLRSRDCASWQRAFRDAAEALRVPQASLKNLRDEFDPIHNNARQGWHRRPLRPNRQRVMGELCDLSDGAVLELVNRLLARDRDAMEQTVGAISSETRPVQNVAERLLTGRQAEEHFLAHARSIVGVDACDIQDCRISARGFDFGIRQRAEIAIEVKGLKRKRGEILFTDREWVEAGSRGKNYWVVVVGNLEGDPIVRKYEDPRSTLALRCRHHTSITASWSTVVQVH